jgi:hypothetical protein
MASQDPCDPTAKWHGVTCETSGGLYHVNRSHIIDSGKHIVFQLHIYLNRFDPFALNLFSVSDLICHPIV